MFGKWLLVSDYKEEKESQIKSLWEKSDYQIIQETHAGWTRLQRQLHQHKLYKYSSHWFQAAAAVALLTMTVGSICWLIRQNQQIEMPQLVELFILYGESSNIFLSDSTEVQLSPGSLLIYPQYFDHRETYTVYLTGQATLQVKKKNFYRKNSRCRRTGLENRLYHRILSWRDLQQDYTRRRNRTI